MISAFVLLVTKGTVRRIKSFSQEQTICPLEKFWVKAEPEPSKMCVSCRLNTFFFFFFLSVKARSWTIEDMCQLSFEYFLFLSVTAGSGTREDVSVVVWILFKKIFKFRSLCFLLHYWTPVGMASDPYWNLCWTGNNCNGAIYGHYTRAWSRTRLGSGWARAAASTSAIQTKLESDVWRHHRSKRVMCLLYSQTTALCPKDAEDVQWNVSHVQPYSVAEPSAARFRPGYNQHNWLGINIAGSLYLRS